MAIEYKKSPDVKEVVSPPAPPPPQPEPEPQPIKMEAPVVEQPDLLVTSLPYLTVYEIFKAFNCGCFYLLLGAE